MKPSKIAVVSCAYATYRRTQPAWAQIIEAKPDLLLMLGDNAYMEWDNSPWELDKLETCYRQQFDVPKFKELIDSVPTLAIWDDHDCGPNDTYGALAPPDLLAASREKFDRWMGFARNNNRPHMYCTWYDIPNVKVIMLDVRTYRTPSFGAGVTLLGKHQEEWLRDQLDPAVTEQRKITIIGSGTCFSEGADHQKVSDYVAFSTDLRERLRFRPGLGDDVGRRALFLGGDIHANRFKTQEEGFHEVISSGVACFRQGTSKLPSDDHADNWSLITIEDKQVKVDYFANDQSHKNRSRTVDIETWTAKALNAAA